MHPNYKFLASDINVFFFRCPEDYHDFALNDFVEPPPLHKKHIAVKKHSVDDAMKGKSLDSILAEALEQVRRGANTNNEDGNQENIKTS